MGRLGFLGFWGFFLALGYAGLWPLRSLGFRVSSVYGCRALRNVAFKFTFVGTMPVSFMEAFITEAQSNEKTCCESQVKKPWPKS